MAGLEPRRGLQGVERGVRRSRSRHGRLALLQQVGHCSEFLDDLLVQRGLGVGRSGDRHGRRRSRGLVDREVQADRQAQRQDACRRRDRHEHAVERFLDRVYDRRERGRGDGLDDHGPHGAVDVRAGRVFALPGEGVAVPDVEPRVVLQLAPGRDGERSGVQHSAASSGSGVLDFVHLISRAESAEVKAVPYYSKVTHGYFPPSRFVPLITSPQADARDIVLRVTPHHSTSVRPCQ